MSSKQLSYFAKYQNDLKEALNPKQKAKSLSLSLPYFLVKGDISGIQEYIFRVKSDGASRSLKGRSFYIQALSEISIQYLSDACTLTDQNLLYNGGGNFYLIVPPEHEHVLATAQKKIDQELLHDDLSLVLCWVRVEDESSFGEIVKKLNQKVSIAKQQKHQSLNYTDVFTPHLKAQSNFAEWEGFTGKLASDSTDRFTVSPSQNQDGVNSDSITKLGYIYQLEVEGAKHAIAFNRSDVDPPRFIVKQLPTWNNELLEVYQASIEQLRQKKQRDDQESAPVKDSLIDFDHLAMLAESRTGSDNLAVLKMDVDNLGSTVAGLRHAHQFQQFANALGFFFGMHISELLKKTFDEHTAFAENIYVIFSGGDDCFMIGAWDAVLAFTQFIKNEFIRFTDNKVTLSAAYLIVSPTFPVVRFASLAEESLNQAKSQKTDKNRISVLGEVFRWEEIEYVEKIKQLLIEAVEENPSKAKGVLRKVMQTTSTFRKIIQSAEKDVLLMRTVYRLTYFLREVPEDVREQLSQLYKNIILNQFISSSMFKESSDTKQLNKVNPMIIPIACKLAELSVRQLKLKVNEQE